MYDNYNYPCGSDTPYAPWNREEVPIKEFRMKVEQLMVKEGVRVETSNYIPQVLIKDEGIVEPEDTSNVDWEQEYKAQHYTILELLSKLEEMARMELKHALPNSLRAQELKGIIDDCKGWKLFDANYEQDE